jgi:putative transmembrane protein PGPGW/Rad52/22 family double-strand break repair protein
MLAGVKDLARLLRRIAITAVGTVILAVGMILLMAPGHGLAVIALALGCVRRRIRMGQAAACRRAGRALSAAYKAAASRAAKACAVLFGVGGIGLGAVLIFTDVLPLSGAGTGAGAAAASLTVLATRVASCLSAPGGSKARRPDGDRNGAAWIILPAVVSAVGIAVLASLWVS